VQTLNNKVTGSALTAAEFNEIPTELQNIIEALGQTLTSSDLNQLGKAIAGYVANGAAFLDSGSADTYVLSAIGSKQAPPGYTNKMRARFIAANTNTGASTVNIASLGVKSIKDFAGNALTAGVIDIYQPNIIEYDSTGGYFRLIPQSTQEVTNLAVLKSLTGFSSRTIYMRSRVANGDGGGGNFYWDSSNLSTAVTNDPQSGIYVPPNSDTTGASGAWVRTHDGTIDVKWFGAVGNGIADDTTPSQKTLDFGSIYKLAVFFSPGNYKITSPLYIDTTSGVIFGAGRGGATKITKSTNTMGSGTRAARSSTVTDSYVVDSILSIRAGDNTYSYNVVIRDIDLISSAASTVDYAIYAPRTARCDIKNIYTQNCDFGFYTFDSWQTTIDGLSSDTCISVLKWADDGSASATGTSLTASRVYANGCAIGFDLYGLQYSTFNSCASDHATNIAYKISTSTGLTFNSCGAEDVQGGTVLNVASSKATFNSFQAYNITGVNTKAALQFDGSSTDIILNTCNFPDFSSITGTDYNMLVQNAAIVTMFNTTIPTNGNTFSSYSSNAVLFNHSNGIVSRTDSTGALPYMQRFTEQTPSLGASWTTVTGREVTYWRDGENIAFDGAVTGGTTTDATVLWTLPSGYRPTKEQWRTTTFFNGSVYADCRIRIQTSGVVQIYGVTANNELTLGGIVFKSPS